MSDHDGRISKLAPVVATFWVMKIAATTLGETAGDLVSMTMNVGYAAASIALLSAFAIVILTTSTAGTTMSDFIYRTLGLG